LGPKKIPPSSLLDEPASLQIINVIDVHSTQSTNATVSGNTKTQVYKSAQ